MLRVALRRKVLCDSRLPSPTGVFLSFNCRPFEEDASAGTNRYFITADLSVECSGSSYKSLVLLATLLILLWPVGVPATFAVLLWRCRRSIATHQPSPMSRAVGFLYSELRDDFYMWEVLQRESNSIS